MRRLISCIIIAATVVAASAAAAAEPIERSGNTFHMAVCAHAHPAGEARCHAHVVTDRAGNPIVNATRNSSPAGYGPADLQSAYNVVQSINQNSTPSGPVIAIVDAYGYPNAESDLAVYRSQYKLPPCTTANGCFRKVNQNGVQGNYPQTNVGWDQEQALDLDMVSAICPNCRIVLVEASSATYGNLATAENTAAALGAHAISNSYGGGESGTTSYEAAYNHAGVAITVSTGDSGYGTEFPATSPHVTAVGGTSLVRASNARGWSETAWSGSGSGCSSVYNKPAWQTDALCAMRMEADTSAIADPNTGVAVYGPVSGRFSGWLVFGGTSVAAPLTAAIYGLNGGGVNYGSNPYLAPAGSLNDVTSGANGSCGGTYFCTAGPGYDGPTGLGTPNGTPAF